VRRCIHRREPTAPHRRLPADRRGAWKLLVDAVAE